MLYGNLCLPPLTQGKKKKKLGRRLKKKKENEQTGIVQ